MKVELELPTAPKGYEYTGEYRPPRKGERFFYGGSALMSDIDYRSEHYPILRAIKVAVIEDYEGKPFRTAKGKGPSYLLFRIQNGWYLAFIETFGDTRISVQPQSEKAIATCLEYFKTGEWVVTNS